MTAVSEDLRIRRLLEVGRSLMTELDQRAVLDRVLEAAREFTGARYAALGILNEQRTELAQFLAVGVDEATRHAIGDLPRGRGMLGVLIDDPRALRLDDVGQHPRSYGCPDGHPLMKSFLGVPIVIRGQAWGNLYLTEKPGGRFTETDEEAAVMLADWTAVAVDNARLYETSERRRQELEKALRGLQATRDVAIAIGDDIGLEHVLELIVKRGRALVEARSLVIMLRDGPDLVVAAGAGHVEAADGVRLPIATSASGEVFRRRRPARIADVPARLLNAPREFAALGVPDPRTALLVPMVYRGAAVGVLAAFDRGSRSGAFSEDDEQLLRTFAASAATAVAMAQSVQADRLRSSLGAADAERRRWARELHDETLQGLGGLRLLLSSALRRTDAGGTEETVREALAYIEREIDNLRAIITELRPAALDELGLHSAIEALLERHREQDGLTITGRLEMPHPAAGEERLRPDLETTVYRLLQEALTNVAKHAQATHVRVLVNESGEELLVEVHDDGVGIAPDAGGSGFGLAGMHERVSLAGGTLSISSGEGGTLVRACLSVHRREGFAAAVAGGPGSGQGS
jgi:signal transduction histidine kinase